MRGWAGAIQEPVTAMAVKIWSYVPNVIAAAIIIAVGLVLAKMLASVITRLLKLSKVDMASEKSGLEKMLKAGEINVSLSDIIGKIIYWLLVLIVAVTAAQALKFTAAVGLMSRLIAYIPNIISAILVLAIGTFLASILGSFILAVANNAGVKKANLLTQFARTALIVLTSAIALEQLQIGKVIITQVVSVIVLSIGAGFAIAFGLGCKDLIGKWFSDFINSCK